MVLAFLTANASSGPSETSRQQRLNRPFKRQASAQVNACSNGAVGHYLSFSILLDEDIGSSAVLRKCEEIVIRARRPKSVAFHDRRPVRHQRLDLRARRSRVPHACNSVGVAAAAGRDLMQLPPFAKEMVGAQAEPERMGVTSEGRRSGST